MVDDYEMGSWESRIKAPYIERFNGNICVKQNEMNKAIKHYNKSLFALKMIFDGNKDRFLNNPSEAIEFVREIEIPCSLNLSHCYNKIGEYHYAIKYASDVLKNDDENVKISKTRKLPIKSFENLKVMKKYPCDWCNTETPHQHRGLCAKHQEIKEKASSVDEFFEALDRQRQLIN